MSQHQHFPVLQANGFTLVEALISLAVTALMILLIGGFMVQNIEQSALTSGQANLLSQSEIALDSIATNLRSSAHVLATNSATDPNNSGGWSSTNATPFSTLVVATAAQNSSGYDIFTDPSYVADANYATEKNNFVYYVDTARHTLNKRVLAYTPHDNNNIAITTCPTANGGCPADAQLLDNVTGFTVTYLDVNGADISSTMPGNASSVNSVQLHVIASKTVYNHLISADYTTRMVFRNG
jgi:Tfp pilus assembly protein FimT